MKILGISGSPRKDGNTDFIIDEVLKGANEAGAEIELISVAEKEIKPCEACDYCTEHKKCKFDDDAAFFFEKMQGADGIVMGSPVYFGNVTAQIKSLIDRERVMWKQGKSLENKVGASVAVAWKWGHFNTLASIDSFFLTNKMLVVSNGGVPGLGLMVYAAGKDDAKTNEDAIKSANELGKRIVDTLLKIQAGN